MTTSQHTRSRRVAVIGGGLSGLAAAVHLARHSPRVEVELFEARRHLGGRAGSFQDPETGEWIDHCQHVAMGCCSAWLEFCCETGLDMCFRTDRVLHFFGTDRRYYRLAASRWLPAPFHLLPALLQLGYLSWSDRWRILAALQRMRSLPHDEVNRGATLDVWLREQRQSPHAMDHFWSTVIVSALSETLDRVSVHAARQVFVEGFMASRQAFELHVPMVPLSQLYDHHLADWLRQRGVRIHLQSAVRQLRGDAQAVHGLQLDPDRHVRFDDYILAIPWWCVARVLDAELVAALPSLVRAEQLESAPITAVHLWFDQPITSLPHAVLMGGIAQWVFRGPAPTVDAQAAEGGPAYYQVVISASRHVQQREQADLVRQVVQELAAVLGERMTTATLLRWRVVTQPRAVFSPLPGATALRPMASTCLPNLTLAGDWTATGWPATMEGAVRSGQQAAALVLARR